MRLRRFLMFSLVAVVLGAVLAGVGYWAYWNYYARFRPVTIVKHQAEIQKLLDQAGWVSPQRSGPWLYMIGYRACAECARYQREEFPKLAEHNVDTRVIVFARADREGLAQSTTAERSTVAELWINRDWGLYLSWMATPRQRWGAPGLKPADSDIARTAVVDASRQFVARLEPLLKANGLGSGYPIMIWRDRDGFLKACACSDRRTYHFIREDLGVADEAPSFISLPEPAPQAGVLLDPQATAAPAARAPAPDPAATPSQPIPYGQVRPGGQPQPPPGKQGEPAPGTQPARPSDSENIFY